MPRGPPVRAQGQATPAGDQVPRVGGARERGRAMPRRARYAVLAGLAAALPVLGGSAARAQSLEPRAYSPAPTGLNFMILGVARTEGGASFDPSVALTDAEIDTVGPILAYARTLDLWGKSGKIDVILPFARVSGSARFDGEPVSREVTGAADPLLRMSVILHGAPAMTPAEFRSYRQDLVIGASLQVSAPLGQYDETRLLNIGTNRWSVKPGIGISQTWGQWTLELEGAATFFTTNPAFFSGGERSQRPLFSGQAHAVYSFRSGSWGSFDATFFTGGRTTFNDRVSNDLQRNWRFGATLAVPIDRQFSVKLYASSGVSARTGNNFDLIGAAVQYRWGVGF